MICENLYEELRNTLPRIQRGPIHLGYFKKTIHIANIFLSGRLKFPIHTLTQGTFI